jgi:HSP20 family molecular chaperone IbpA
VSEIKDVEARTRRELNHSKVRNSSELRTIAEDHVQRKESLKEVQKQDLVEIQDENERKLAAEAEKKEKVLQNMKANLENTQKMTDKQLADLEKTAEKEKLDIRSKLNHDRARVKEEHELHLDEMNDTFNTKSRSIHSQGERQLSDLSHDKREQLSSVKQQHDHKLSMKNEEFKTRYNRDETTNKRTKDQQDHMYKRERHQTNVRQQTELDKLTRTHTDQAEKIDTNFRKELKGKELEQESAYEKSLGAHTSDLKNLEDKHKKVVSKLKETLTEEVKKTVVRSDDPFFQLTELKPALKDYEDRVEISVDIPEHSKQDLRLTMNGKDAIITFSRRFADSHKNEAGILNSVNKVESFTTKMTAKAALDPKSVKSTFENGTMTYTIKKA